MKDVALQYIRRQQTGDTGVYTRGTVTFGDVPDKNAQTAKKLFGIQGYNENAEKLKMELSRALRAMYGANVSLGKLDVSSKIPGEKEREQLKRIDEAEIARDRAVKDLTNFCRACAPGVMPCAFCEFAANGNCDKYKADGSCFAYKIKHRDDMTLDEYAMLAQRTSNTKNKADKMLNGILGLTGEAGETADYYKKCAFQGEKLDTSKMVEELGDTLWYICECAEALGVTLGEIARENIKKLQERYPDGFDVERSKNR